MWLLLIICIIVLCFGIVVFFGAPYLPTLKTQQSQALDLLDLQPGQTLLELGSGDGRMLRAAAKQGLTAVGYELNPILFIISWLLCLKYGNKVRIHLSNFWVGDWPSTDGIYVFLLDKYMKKLDKKIIQQYDGRNIKLVSYTFTVPGKKPTKTRDALHLYEYKTRS